MSAVASATSWSVIGWPSTLARTLGSARAGDAKLKAAPSPSANASTAVRGRTKKMAVMGAPLRRAERRSPVVYLAGGYRRNRARLREARAAGWAKIEPRRSKPAPLPVRSLCFRRARKAVFRFCRSAAGETIVASPALAQPARERAGKGQRRRAPERDLGCMRRRAPERDLGCMRRRAPERDRRQRRSERLADQPAGGLQAGRATASLARRAADDHPVVGRLEEAEAEAADREPPGERARMGMAADSERRQDEPAAHDQEPDAAEEAGDEPVGEPSGDRRDERGRDRPRGEQESGGGRRKAQPVLEEEGQGHDSQARRAERADRRREREREHRPAQEIDRQKRR